MVERYPLPRIEDLLSCLSIGKVFSKLDLSHAYMQLTLDPESKKYVTISTQKGSSSTQDFRLEYRQYQLFSKGLWSGFFMVFLIQLCTLMIF